MKNLSLVLFLFFSINLSFNTMAQESSKIDEKASLMCSCINKMLDDLHPQLKVFIKDIDANGQQKAQENLTQYIVDNPEEAESFMQSIQKFSDFENYISTIDGCDNLPEKMKEGEEDIDEFESKLVSYFETNEQCSYAYIFYKMGTGKK